MTTSLLLAIALASTYAPPPGPTPEEIYAASNAPFGAMIGRYELEQEFRRESDGTHVGVVRPTAEDSIRVPWWGNHRVENLVGPWDAVSRRIGSIRDAEGQRISIEEAFADDPAARTSYLVVTQIESRAHDGLQRCAASIVGVGPEILPGADHETLVATPYGTISGCGLVKDWASVVDPKANPQEAEKQLMSALSRALGFALHRRTLQLDPKKPQRPKDDPAP